MEDQKQVIDVTLHWLTDFVIKYNICPFAKRELITDNIRIVVSDSELQEQLLENLYIELQYLVEHQDLSTTLLIHPKVLKQFIEYNQFLDVADRLLEQNGWVGEFQIASFHPKYQFAETEDTSAENFTNRSPYAMLHLLREHQVEKSIQQYPDIDQIPINNIKTMNQIGYSKLQSQLDGFLNENK